MVESGCPFLVDSQGLPVHDVAMGVFGANGHRFDVLSAYWARSPRNTSIRAFRTTSDPVVRRFHRDQAEQLQNVFAPYREGSLPPTVGGSGSRVTASLDRQLHVVDIFMVP